MVRSFTPSSSPPPLPPLPISAQIYAYLKLLIATRKEKESNKGFKVN